MRTTNDSNTCRWCGVGIFFKYGDSTSDRPFARASGSLAVSIKSWRAISVRAIPMHELVGFDPMEEHINELTASAKHNTLRQRSALARRRNLDIILWSRKRVTSFNAGVL